MKLVSCGENTIGSFFTRLAIARLAKIYFEEGSFTQLDPRTFIFSLIDETDEKHVIIFYGKEGKAIFEELRRKDDWITTWATENAVCCILVDNTSGSIYNENVEIVQMPLREIEEFITVPIGYKGKRTLRFY